MGYLLPILSALPFAGIVYFLLIRGSPAPLVMMGTYIFTSILLLFFWNLKGVDVAGISLFGVLKSFEIFFVFFGILLVLSLLEKTKKLSALELFFRSVSKEKHVLMIFIGWFLVNFFEGIAGFGTPVAIAAPLLVLCGYRPITAIAVPLVANSLGTPFGAFGTPVLFGIATSVPSANMEEIIFLISCINGALSIIVPILLLVFTLFLEGEKISIKKYIPFALVSGVSFAVPFILTAIYLGGELPSVMGSLIGLSIVFLLMKKGVFGDALKISKNPHTTEALKSFLPYAVIIALFLFSRIDLFSFGSFLKSIQFSVEWNTLSYSLHAYSPGIIILLSFFVFALFSLRSFQEWKDVFTESFQKGKRSFLTLLFTLAFVELLIQSGMGGVKNIPYILGELFSGMAWEYQFVAPFIGAFGSFIAGSATVSNLIFGGLQENAALGNGLSASLVLALQTVGASYGNIFAIHNIIAASSTVGVHHQESVIIRKNALFVVVFSFFASILGILIYSFLKE